MAKKTTYIPEYQFPQSVKEGVQIISHEEFEASPSHDTAAPHRDDHYLLFVSRGGSVEAAIDFDDVKISGPFIALITPGQVHQVIRADVPEGYALGFSKELMPVELKPVLEYYFLQEHTFSGSPQLLDDLIAIIKIMRKAKQKNRPGQLAVLRYFLKALLALIVDEIDIRKDKTAGNRAKKIEHDFFQLLQFHFKHWKRPADYAKALNITVSHLNDTIKGNTGASVSIQIQRYIMTEARRMLYYTDNNIQEIAYALGYDDNAYFIRVFKKATKTTPAAFRSQIRH